MVVLVVVQMHAQVGIGGVPPVVNIVVEVVMRDVGRGGLNELRPPIVLVSHGDGGGVAR